VYKSVEKWITTKKVKIAVFPTVIAKTPKQQKNEKERKVGKCLIVSVASINIVLMLKEE